MPSKPAALSLPVVKISRRGAKRLQDGHVWVYRSDIVSADGIAPGAAVGITDERGKFLGTALYSSSSQIAIRMISTHAVDDLSRLLRERIQGAISYRERVVRDTDAYRVIFSEADFLPGLIVDRYNDLLSIQALTQAMDAEPVRSVVVAELTRALETGSHRRTGRSPHPRTGAAAGPAFRPDPGRKDQHDCHHERRALSL